MLELKDIIKKCYYDTKKIVKHFQNKKKYLTISLMKDVIDELLKLTKKRNYDDLTYVCKDKNIGVKSCDDFYKTIIF